MQPATKILGLDGFYDESALPTLIKREGMAVWENGEVIILDRRKLPQSQVYINCKTTNEVAEAIEMMVIQGAFSISIAAGYGLALSAQKNNLSIKNLREAAARLKATRPTGLALSRVMDLCLSRAETAIENGSSVVDKIIETTDIVASDLAKQARKTAQYALNLLNDGDTILTHCFPDRSYAYLLMEAKYNNISLNVICSETRPYLQGSKLTSWCAAELGFEVHVITDGMGGALMKEGTINAFITAADTVCMDGSVANKIGTYQYALAANANNVPYYVLRQSGPDNENKSRGDIVIEQRSGQDILTFNGVRITPNNVKGRYPCFDVTPSELVSSIITDRGIFNANAIHSYNEKEPFLDNLV